MKSLLIEVWSRSTLWLSKAQILAFFKFAILLNDRYRSEYCFSLWWKRCTLLQKLCVFIRYTSVEVLELIVLLKFEVFGLRNNNIDRINTSYAFNSLKNNYLLVYSLLMGILHNLFSFLLPFRSKLTKLVFRLVFMR